MISRFAKAFAILAVFAGIGAAGAAVFWTSVLPTSAAETTMAPEPEQGPDVLVHGASAVVLGNPRGDVTVVEFFDYQCPVCRRVHPAVKQLAADDTSVRIVHKHWPVFGAASIYASKLALAARWQERYEEVHDAFMAIRGRLDEEKLRQAAMAAGLDLARAERDLKERGDEINAAFREAQLHAAMLQLQGTPGFVIGRYLVPGGLDLSGMKKIVADVRAEKGDERE